MTDVHLLDRPTYLYAEVDRLLGLASGTARRWINGYDRDGREYAPILRVARQETQWATWGNFVEARMLAEYRNEKVPTARLRATVQWLRDTFSLDYPLAHLRPYLSVDHRDLAVDLGRIAPTEEGRLIARTGQRLLQSNEELMRSATIAVGGDGEKFAAEIGPDPEFPGIRINPDRLSGQPTIAGRRIVVAMIAGLVDAGEAPDDIAADYGLSLAEVDAAGQYVKKHRLAA